MFCFPNEITISIKGMCHLKVLFCKYIRIRVFVLFFFFVSLGLFIAHTCDPSTQKAEADDLKSRPAWVRQTDKEMKQIHIKFLRKNKNLGSRSRQVFVNEESFIYKGISRAARTT